MWYKWGGRFVHVWVIPGKEGHDFGGESFRNRAWLWRRDGAWFTSVIRVRISGKASGLHPLLIPHPLHHNFHVGFEVMNSCSRSRSWDEQKKLKAPTTLIFRSSFMPLRIQSVPDIINEGSIIMITYRPSGTEMKASDKTQTPETCEVEKGDWIKER